MYIADGIAYAGERAPILKVSELRPLSDFRLWLRFNNSEAKIFYFKPLLNAPAFVKLAKPEIFESVYLEYGVPVWNDGEIDIAPEYLYERGKKAE